MKAKVLPFRFSLDHDLVCLIYERVTNLNTIVSFYEDLYDSFDIAIAEEDTERLHWLNEQLSKEIRYLYGLCDKLMDATEENYNEDAFFREHDPADSDDT